MSTTPSSVSASSAVQMNAGQWAQLVALGVIWGGSFYFAEIALVEYSAMSIVLARTVIAAPVLGLLLWLRRIPLPRDRRFYGWLFVMGLINNVIPMSLLFWSQNLIPSGLAAVMNATTPLWGVLLAHYVIRSERITPLRLAGVLCGLFGVALLLGWKFHGGALLVELAALAGALCYAVGGFYARRFKGLPALLPATGQVIASALILLPVVSLIDQPWRNGMPSQPVLLALLGLGLLCTALAFVMYFSLLDRIGTTNILLVTFVIPVSAVLLGYLFLSERLGLHQLGGMLLVLLGLLILDGRLPRSLGRLMLKRAG
jgi:drug/metabolite transporter (DMT)-like permease